MIDIPVEQGWQRFLDRLKELWGKPCEPTPTMASSQPASFAESATKG